uniref:Uncharacterized protein n=1 Tax=Klebsiella pneumoniae TaxID=573 RepID=A0A8B0SY37_KLEPN|nr:hypothetical protein [Klebsiella pneumoniae]
MIMRIFVDKDSHYQQKKLLGLIKIYFINKHNQYMELQHRDVS